MDIAFKNRDRVNRNNSIIFGMALILNFIVGTVCDFISVSNLFPVTMFCLGMFAIINNIYYKRIQYTVSISLFVIISLFIIQIIFGILVVESSTTLYYAECLVLIGFPSIYISSVNIDIAKVRHTVLLLSILCFSHFLKIISNEYTVYTSGEQMGNAYAVLIICFISLWTLFDSKDIIIWKILSVVNAVMCFSILIKVMTRGAWVCIIAFLCFLLCKKIQNKKILLFIIVGAPVLIIIMNLFVSRYLIDTKWYYYMFTSKSGDFLNGRNELFEYAFTDRGIMAALVGSGIGSYFVEYGTYPHNVIVHLYYEQGIIALVLALGIFFAHGKGVIKSALNFSQRDFLLVTIMCAVLIKLMVSSYFWIEQLFWMMMGMLIHRGHTRTKNCQQEEEIGYE